MCQIETDNKRRASIFVKTYKKNKIKTPRLDTTIGSKRKRTKIKQTENTNVIMG